MKAIFIGSNYENGEYEVLNGKSYKIDIGTVDSHGKEKIMLIDIFDADSERWLLGMYYKNLENFFSDWRFYKGAVDVCM